MSNSEIKIAIVDYNTGNIKSVQNALDAIVGAFRETPLQAIVTSDAEEIKKADKVILPGVGDARFAIGELGKLKLIDTLQSLAQPVLGICLGMQILFDFSDEGSVECLGIMHGRIKKFETSTLKVPHIGWNSVSFGYENDNDNCRFAESLHDGIAQNEYFYFLHSYYAPICAYTIGETEYGRAFSSAVKKDNFYGVQFHPEKSGKAGLKFLQNFLTVGTTLGLSLQNTNKL